MMTVIDREQIRRAFYIEGKSRRQIAREFQRSYKTIRKALASAEPTPYQLDKPKPAPKLDPFKPHIEDLLQAEANLPRKQRYTTRTLFKIIRKAGYQGSESNLRRYIGRRRRELKQTHPPIFIPLSFPPGQSAQVDWGEAVVIMQGVQRKVQLFIMRLNYSRRSFAIAFPTQRQEAFFTAHVAALHFFGGVPHTIVYDNLKTAVQKVLQGRNRQEQTRFIQLRSHYLFTSRFCTPAKGHEKGGVEHAVKYIRQNCLTPLIEVANFKELNQLLLTFCQSEDKRQVSGQKETIGRMFKQEQSQLLPLPTHDFPTYVTREVVLNRYCQITFETNRYSVPASQAAKQLTLHIYPLHIEIWHQQQQLARHTRSYERQQDILDPLHYLPLLIQRPGAFEHAAPLQQWRAEWPPLYEQLLAHLRQQQSANKAVREFISILQLHQTYTATQITAAITAAFSDNIVHLAGITFCLHKLCDTAATPAPLDLSDQPNLAQIGTAAVPASTYNQLLHTVSPCPISN